MSNSTSKEKKLTLIVMIEGARTFNDQYVSNQKLQVLVNKTLENLSLSDGDKRQLLRGDGTVLGDFKTTIEEAGLRDGETLRFVLKSAPKPDEPKKFA